jgi:hypothetical protein
VLHSSADKVHIKLRFTRYDAADRVLGVYRTLWIVTRQGDRWGVQARSTFAA